MTAERDAAKRDLRARVDQFVATGNPDVVCCPEATAAAVALGRNTTADSSDCDEVIELLGWFHLCRNRLLAPGAPLPDRHTTARLLAPVHRAAPQSLPILVLVTIELLAGLPPYRVPEELAGKAINLMSRGAAGDLASVTKAINLFLDAVSVASVDHPDRAAMLSNAAWGWLTIYSMTGDRSIIGHAVRTGEEAVAALMPGAHRAVALNNLGLALRLRFDQTGNPDDLDRAIVLLTEAIEYTPQDDVDWAVRKNNLGVALGLRYQHSGRRSDVDRALVALHEAAEATRPHRPERPGYFGDLAYFHWVRFQHTGDPVDLAAAAGHFGVAATSQDGQLRQRALAYLAAVETERTKHSHHGRVRAVTAVVTPSRDREAAPDQQALLSQAEDQYRRALDTGYLDELAATVPLLRRALAVTPLDHPAGVGCRFSLANALVVSFRASAELPTLDEAIAVLTELASVLPRGDEDRKIALNNLSSALAIRFGYLAELADLTRAIETTREALATDPHDVPLLANLCNLLVDRHRWSMAPDDLDEAVAVGEQAVEFTPPQANYRHGPLCNLGKARLERYRLGADPDDLDSGIALLQQASELLPPDGVDRITILSMLAAAWRDRFKARGDRADIDRAIDTGRFLGSLGPQVPYLAGDVLTGLGICLNLRADAFDREEDRTEAIAIWRTVAASPGPARMRFIAAAAAAVNQSEHDRPAGAVEDYATAVGLLPLLTWPGLGRASREKHLGDYPGLAVQAAASAIAAGDPGRAIELLEQGRSVLWGQLLQIRSDLTVLHDAHPGLATQLDRLRCMLDQSDVDQAEELRVPVHRVRTASDG